jgi:hypothetical protein
MGKSATAGSGWSARLVTGVVIAAMVAAATGPHANAQGTRADYERAAALRERVQGRVTGTVSSVSWLDGSRLW